MEPRIQYAKTPDGERIAYAVLGEGTPLIFSSGVFGRLHTYARGPNELMKGAPEGPVAVDSVVAQGFRVVIYDGRGMGFSNRATADFSLKSRVTDLETVIEAAGLHQPVLVYLGSGGGAAATYASHLPQRVSHFVAINPATAFRDLRERNPAILITRALEPVADAEWELITKTVARSGFELADDEPVEELAATFRDSMTPAGFFAYLRATTDTNLEDVWASIGVPTLVIHARTSGQGRYRQSCQTLAGLIPGAQFVETDDPARAIREFVGGPVASEREPSPASISGSGTAVILFADIADSTGLTERLGDAAFRDRARQLDGALRKIIADHAGTPIEGKLLGDGVLAVFIGAAQAIEAALGCGRAGDEASLPLHLGLHAGDVIREKDPDGRDNVYGGAVNIASRIASASAPGEVLVSDTVRGLARTSAGVSFEDRGSHDLKGIAEPQRLFVVISG